jgi:hypothetical protein
MLGKNHSSPVRLSDVIQTTAIPTVKAAVTDMLMNSDSTRRTPLDVARYQDLAERIQQHSLELQYANN